MNTTADLIFSIVLFAVVLLTPLQVWHEQRRVERELAMGHELDHFGELIMTIQLQWAVASLLFVGWLFTTGSWSGVFLVLGWPSWSDGSWLAYAGGLLASSLLVAQTILLRGREDKLAKIRAQLGSLTQYAPRTPRDQRIVDALSLTAGICEELVYRGLLLGTLASLIGLWPAVAASTLIFGLSHVYQGLGGVLRTGAFGAVAALLTVFSGSIYLAVVVHIITDLSQGRLIAMAVRERGQVSF